MGNNMLNRYLFDDLKLKELREKQGIKSYALYCYLMELIHAEKNNKLFIDENMKNVILADTGLEEVIFYRMLNSMLKLNIFDSKSYYEEKFLVSTYKN